MKTIKTKPTVICAAVLTPEMYLLIFMCVVFLMPCWVSGDVVFHNHYQNVEVEIRGNGEIIEEDEQNDDCGQDADLMAEADYWGYGYGKSYLKTTYSSDRLTVDGSVWLEVLPTWDFNDISARGRVYYQTVITVTDEPVWLRIKGYLTTSCDHEADDHFLVGSPVWYWYVENNQEEKVWMFDTALFEVGEHLLYGGINYVITAEWGGSEDTLYADYYFVAEVVSPPEFEDSEADLNYDGKVNFEDFALFASAWLWGV